MVKKTKKSETMKTKINIAATKAILIFFLVSGLQLQYLMAKSPVNSGPSKATFELIVLPNAPKAATFEDLVPERSTSPLSLAPIIPKEATFDDDDSSIEVSSELLKEVAPVTPAEADFNDLVPDSSKDGKDVKDVKFIVPFQTGFEDF
jgi:hypothetical protein